MVKKSAIGVMESGRMRERKDVRHEEQNQEEERGGEVTRKGNHQAKTFSHENKEEPAGQSQLHAAPISGLLVFTVM